MSENKELLKVNNLGITFFTDRGALPAVQEVSFTVQALFPSRPSRRTAMWKS